MMIIPSLSGFGNQIAGDILAGIGKWVCSEELVRVGRHYRDTGEMQRTMADARNVIQRSLRQRNPLH